MSGRFALRARYPAFELAAEAAWDAPCAALFGPSGAGKSTVVEALLGLRPEVAGEVELAGRRLDGVPPHERRLGWAPQDAALFEHMTVRANLDFAVGAGGDAGAAAEAVEALEIGALLDRPADRLSGGERSRVALARALAARPRFLLLDEPLASLDRPLRSRVLPFLEGLARERGLPCLVVTHDPLEVLALASHVFVLEGGRVVQDGAPREVFASAAAFGSLAALGAENRFPVEVVERGPGTLVVATPAGQRLALVRVAGFPEPREVAVRAEDVVLATEEPRGVSTRNVFRATVTALEELGGQVDVHLEHAGEAWCAKLTGEAVAAMGLGRGVEVVVLVKAHSVHGV